MKSRQSTVAKCLSGRSEWHTSADAMCWISLKSFLIHLNDKKKPCSALYENLDQFRMDGISLKSEIGQNVPFLMAKLSIMLRTGAIISKLLLINTAFV